MKNNVLEIKNSLKDSLNTLYSKNSKEKLLVTLCELDDIKSLLTYDIIQVKSFLKRVQRFMNR
jgi:hypothetical protein